jgi:cation diffusion facilitator CzcD-associated flavoprotein CzcO
MDRSLRFVVIGGGMAGILAVIRLRELGFTNVIAYEKADRLGGTWRENTYPGIACDVPSYLYSYSFAPNPDWSHMFSPGGEILEYLEDVARRHDVLDAFVFGAEVERLNWTAGRWHLRTKDGRSDEADVVIAATGVLHHPSYPDIEGVATFAGPCFHTARWDHSVAMEGKRVGIIGTGSSAVQIVCALADVVGQLTLFQRTPQWVLPIDNPEVPKADKDRLREHPEELRAIRDEIGERFSMGFSAAVVDAESEHLKGIEELCRQNLEDHVTDPELRERLRPNYRAACKRLIVAPDFYESITKPNAQVISEKVERVEPRGVRTADGVLHELDVLVLATGFQVDRFLRPINVTGIGGLSLDDVWAARPSAYLSISIPGFPNLFMLNGPNGPVGNFSLIDVAELQFEYIMRLLQPVREGRCVAVAASAEAAERFEADRVEAAKRTVWVTGCRSWYLDDRGIPAAWPWTMERFREAMTEPVLADYELIA